ncbi:MAG: metallophosphoesterase [Desulfobacteraceae bacterium]|jgi:UDP-2,3-diacylglucosamine pyrophosphatase LpxH
MSWWELVLEKVHSGEVLFTPGRGMEGIRKSPFTIVAREPSRLIVSSGRSRIPLERECFEAVEKAFSSDPSIWLRAASKHGKEPLENSVEKLVREATGSQLARGNYLCSMLEKCGLVRYSMRGHRKGIELPGRPEHPEEPLPPPSRGEVQPALEQGQSREEPFNIAIISDLHLSEGRDPRTKKFKKNEDYFFDGQFDRFLRYLEEESEDRGRKWHLLIAGDMVDFLQVTSRPREPGFHVAEREIEYGLRTSPEKTVWKLKTIMKGHKVFFRALGRFLCAGNRCTIITGNHDIEWTVPEQQEAFREEMKAYLPKGAHIPSDLLSGSIDFCPWFFYVPGLVWVEHGHQYDGMNSFDYFLAPYLPNSDEIMLPGASFFVRYLFNKVEQRDPFADNIKPISAYVRRYGLRLLFSPQIMKHVRYFLEILRKIRKFKPEELEALRQKNEERIREEARRFGIDVEKVDTVRSHWVPSFAYNESKLRNILYFLYYNAGRTYRGIALAIRKQLGVKYVIFGHTHETDLLLLSRTKKAEYVNSGTWTKIFSRNPGERLLRDEQESIFVQILRDEKDKLELMKWRDDLGRGERVNLFE